MLLFIGALAGLISSLAASPTAAAAVSAGTTAAGAATAKAASDAAAAEAAANAATESVLAQQVAKTALAGNVMGQATSLPSGLIYGPGGMGPPTPAPSIWNMMQDVGSRFAKGFAANAPIGALVGASSAPRGQRTRSALIGALGSGGIGGVAGGVSGLADPSLGQAEAISAANATGAPGTSLVRFGEGMSRLGKGSLNALLERAFGDQPVEQLLGVADKGATRGILPAIGSQMMIRLGGNNGVPVKPFGRYGATGRALRVRPQGRRVYVGR